MRYRPGLSWPVACVPVLDGLFGTSRPILICRHARRRYIMARDYMTLKIWDVNMESQPVQTIKVHEHLRSKLCELYESDCIFDKFESSWAKDSKHVCSGTYDNKLQIWDAFSEGTTALECTTAAITPTRKNSFKGPPLPHRLSPHTHVTLPNPHSHDTPQPQLRPAHLCTCAPSPRLVLPSPDGLTRSRPRPIPLAIPLANPPRLQVSWA